jgi:hypothetical protein
MLTLRARSDVQAEHDRAAAKLGGGFGPALTRHERLVLGAVVDSLGWVLGYTDKAPWTGRVMPNPGAKGLFSEWSAAETVNHNAALMRDDEERFWYGSAVEHALAWARGSDTTTPTHEGW